MWEEEDEGRLHRRSDFSASSGETSRSLPGRDQLKDVARSTGRSVGHCTLAERQAGHMWAYLTCVHALCHLQSGVHVHSGVPASTTPELLFESPAPRYSPLCPGHSNGSGLNDFSSHVVLLNCVFMKVNLCTSWEQKSSSTLGPHELHSQLSFPKERLWFAFPW